MNYRFAESSVKNTPAFCRNLSSADGFNKMGKPISPPRKANASVRKPKR